MTPIADFRPGAHYLGRHRCEFVVWAPHAREMFLHLLTPAERLVAMTAVGNGYWRTVADAVPPGASYRYRLGADGPERPDPAAALQPQGVHQPSAVVDHGSFAWSDDDWRGRELDTLVIYELHVGTFTPAGTFAAVIPRLPELQDLGITAIELMPVAQFPGVRNWGYDGVHPFAVQHSYGGPDGLKELVDACHRLGLAVILDVVYNHLGPEGNYLRDFGPYFTDRYRTPWGEAVNLDGPESDPVRRFFITNALYWLEHYHLDGLRLDATDRIYDFSARPFLAELAAAVEEFSRRQRRRVLLIAEDDRNDPRLIRPPAQGGFGLDALWSDDYHHALHAMLTGEDSGYYADFGAVADLARATAEGFVYDGRYSRYRRRRHGSSARDRQGRQLVVCSQNHDQVGNRMFGDRLVTLVGFEGAKTAAAAVLLSPFVPLLFMGEEYAEQAPFLFFADFLDPALRRAVHDGRQEEFAAFRWRGEPPDAHDEETFRRSRLDWPARGREPGRTMLAFYRELLRLRRELPALARLDPAAAATTAREEQRVLTVRRRHDEGDVLLLLNFGREEAICPPAPAPGTLLLASAATAWGGPGNQLPETLGDGDLRLPGRSCALYRLE